MGAVDVAAEQSEPPPIPAISALSFSELNSLVEKYSTIQTESANPNSTTKTKNSIRYSEHQNSPLLRPQTLSSMQIQWRSNSRDSPKTLSERKTAHLRPPHQNPHQHLRNSAADSAGQAAATGGVPANPISSNLHRRLRRRRCSERHES